MALETSRMTQRLTERGVFLTVHESSPAAGLANSLDKSSDSERPATSEERKRPRFQGLLERERRDSNPRPPA